MTDAEYLDSLLKRAETWLAQPERNMLNEHDDLVYRLTRVGHVLLAAMADSRVSSHTRLITLEDE